MTTRTWRLGTPLVFAASGALFVVSATNSEGTDLRPDPTNDLYGVVRSEDAHVKELEATVERLRTDVDRLTQQVDDAQVRRAQRAADRLQAPAGRTELVGPGVTVTLSDAPKELQLQASEDEIDYLVVHQGDIQAVVNAMWEAGAEAVTIQGQRVVTTTGIKCAGSTVELNGLYFPQPYVISAIGNPSQLEAGILSDEFIAIYRAQSEDERVQVGWELEREEQIVAPSYDGLLPSLEYARPLDG
jgi:uncharacterized protein YlxW (UPF0749 family)